MLNSRERRKGGRGKGERVWWRKGGKEEE